MANEWVEKLSTAEKLKVAKIIAGAYKEGTRDFVTAHNDKLPMSIVFDRSATYAKLELLFGDVVSMNIIDT